MKSAPDSNELQPPSLRRQPDDGETTVFRRPSLPLVATRSPSRSRAYAYGAALLVALVGSLAGLVAWARAAATTTPPPMTPTTMMLTTKTATATRMDARAPIRLPPIALVAASSADELAAVLEAADVTSVRAGPDDAGIVRRVVARGTAVARGSPLVTLRRADPEPARRLAELDALLEQYDDASPTAPALERARAAYERAVAESREVAVVRAPSAGLVVGVPPHVGDVVAAGAEVARVAAVVQLVVPARDVDGDGADCRVALYDRGRAVVDGTLVAAVPDAAGRTIALARLPVDVPLGAIGRVKAVCR